MNEFAPVASIVPTGVCKSSPTILPRAPDTGAGATSFSAACAAVSRSLVSDNALCAGYLSAASHHPIAPSRA